MQYATLLEYNTSARHEVLKRKMFDTSGGGDMGQLLFFASPAYTVISLVYGAFLVRLNMFLTRFLIAFTLCTLIELHYKFWRWERVTDRGSTHTSHP